MKMQENYWNNRKHGNVFHSIQMLRHFCDILKNKELKVNCIKNVDDIKEQSYLQPLIDNDEAIPYISCFDYSTDESIPLWNMYAGDKYGVKIQFELSHIGSPKVLVML